MLGSAPGRLDLLGGVADYAGALVLEAPTRVTTTVDALPADRFVIGPATFEPEELVALASLDYVDLRAELGHLPRWVTYPLGVALVLLRHGLIEPPTVELHVRSDVPQSVGVSSSAALEVATARALAPGADPMQLALLCQEAENQVVGAPCGVMDQVAVSVGRPGALLPILCRPASVAAAVDLPPALEVVGWPTGAEHDVRGLPYRRARTAAFMGKRIVEAAVGERCGWISELPSGAVALLPEVVRGDEYLDRWDGTDDPITTVDPNVDYPVRAATAFGGEEHRRSEQLLASLADPSGTRPILAASHAGYDAMGLGHPLADAVVAAALERPSVLGARSSGGGSGGTVVVLCERGALDDVEGTIR